MKTMRFLGCLCVGLLATAHVAIAEDAGDAAQARHLKEARRLLDGKQPDKAIQKEIEPVIKYYESKYAQESRKIYCSRTPTETLMYLLGAAASNLTESAATNSGAIAIGPEWAEAYFMKAYALTDLGRTSEASQNVKRALELSPSNPQYLCELAYLYQQDKKWLESQELFVQAEEFARTLSPADSKVAELTKALRGQGYNLIELGQLDKAEAKYRECLKLDANDRKAKNELKYIQDLRKGPKAQSSLIK
jgi:Flp pilus assembly protein TadD